MVRMIALVSDQRMQNVFPFFQQGNAYEQLILVLSKDRKSQKPQQRYLDSATHLSSILKAKTKVVISDWYVDAYDIADVKRCVESLIQEAGNPEQVIVNISGGTKPMAIGALQAAQTLGVDSLYVATENGEQLILRTDGSVEASPLNLVGLDVDCYIRAHGERIATSLSVDEFTTMQIAWADGIALHYEALYRDIIAPLTRNIIKQGSLPAVQQVLTKRQIAAAQQLAESGLWEYDAIHRVVAVYNAAAADSIKGGWVELYTALELRRSGFFDDVLLNIKLVGVEGEIDIAAVSAGKLVLVECKSNVQQSQQLAKLESFRRRLGGTFAHAYYVRASQDYAKRITVQCAKYLLDGVFFGQELHSMGKRIGQRIRTGQ
jgi:hypothetical protein